MRMLSADEITQDFLTRYIGGEMDYQTKNQVSCYRAKISDVAIQGEVVHISFAWCGQRTYSGPVCYWEHYEATGYPYGVHSVRYTELNGGSLQILNIKSGEKALLYLSGARTTHPDYTLYFPKHLEEMVRRDYLAISPQELTA